MTVNGNGNGTRTAEVAGLAAELRAEGLTGPQLVEHIGGRFPELAGDGRIEDMLEQVAPGWSTPPIERAADPRISADLTEMYGLHSPIARFTVWGRRADSPADLHLADGTIIRFAQVRDLVRHDDLLMAVALQTGGRSKVPPMKKAELQDAFLALQGLAQITEGDDTCAEVDEWVNRFLHTTGGQFIRADRAEGPEWFEALGELRSQRYDPHITLRPIVLMEQPSGDLLLRATDLLLYVTRILGVRIDRSTLKARALQAGYGHRIEQKWRPGAERRGADDKHKVAVIVVPRGDDHTARTRVPDVPTYTRPRTHARLHGGTSGTEVQTAAGARP